MEVVAKLTLIASVVMFGYNLYQLLMGYETICQKAEEFKRLAVESESDEISVKWTNVLITGILSVVFTALVFFANFAYWMVGVVALKMVCTILLSHKEIERAFLPSKMDKKFFMWSKVDSAANVVMGLAVAVVLIS